MGLCFLGPSLEGLSALGVWVPWEGSSGLGCIVLEAVLWATVASSLSFGAHVTKISPSMAGYRVPEENLYYVWPNDYSDEEGSEEEETSDEEEESSEDKNGNKTTPDAT